MLREKVPPITVPSIVLFELWYGIAKSAHPQRNANALDDFMAGPIQLLSFEADDAREAGDIRASLERAGTPIGPYDILIAAQARRRGATLATGNIREFARVPGLRTEELGGLTGRAWRRRRDGDRVSPRRP